MKQKNKTTADKAIRSSLRIFWQDSYDDTRSYFIPYSFATSPLIFSCGNGVEGSSHYRNSQSGFQPCLTLYTNNCCGGMTCFTRILCSRYLFFNRYLELLQPNWIPKLKEIAESNTLEIFLLVGEIIVRRRFNGLNRKLSNSLSWLIALSTQTSSLSLTIKMTFTSGNNLKMSS